MSKKNAELAEAIYREISGADNREEHERTVSEILDWLENGEPVTDEMVTELAVQYQNEWGNVEE